MQSCINSNVWNNSTTEIQKEYYTFSTICSSLFLSWLKLNGPWSLLLYIYVQKMLFYLITFLNQIALLLQQEHSKDMFL